MTSAARATGSRENFAEESAAAFERRAAVPARAQELTLNARVESAAHIRGERAMPAKEKSLEDLFLMTLKDIYYAEKQILRALPKMAKAAESDELRQAFEKHRGETEGQVRRLEQVFEIIGKKAAGKTCEAIQGLIEEGKEVMEDFAESEALDAGLVAAAQAVEHYEISRYGTLRTWAQELGLKNAVKLLDETLQEEKKTDQLLTELAEARVNQKAA
jgi:ferritin-like metal-binding protein YciE